jgi:hypothetical protein
MTNDKGAEHEKRARQIQLANKLWDAISLHQMHPGKGDLNWHYYAVNDLIAPILQDAHEAGYKKATVGSAIKETIAYKCGYDAGRSELLAEVVPALEFYGDDKGTYSLPWREGSGYWLKHCDDCSDPVDRFIQDGGKQARELLAKLNAEVEKKDD